MSMITFRKHSYFGKYLELNPLGETKICGFDCLYCNLGPSVVKIGDLKKIYGGDSSLIPTPEALAQEFRIALNGYKVNTGDTDPSVLIISGNGEPTLHPHFEELIKELLNARNEMLAQDFKIFCFTNGENLGDRKVISALSLLDQVYLKLDCGTEADFKSLNRPRTRTTLEKILFEARGLSNLSIQTTVLGGPYALTPGHHLEEWLELVALLKPKEVVLTLAKPFKAKARPGQTPLDTSIFAAEEDLYRLHHWLDRRLGIKAQVDFEDAS